MATSGTIAFNSTRNEMVKRAYRIVGVLSHGHTVDADQLAEGQEELNSLVKELQNDGVRLWSLDWTQHTLTASTRVTGTDAVVYKCIRSHTSSTATKPITGANYTSFWASEPGGSGAVVWADATAYTSISDFTLPDNTLGIEKAFVRENGTDTDMVIGSWRDYLDICQKDSQGRPTFISLDESIQTPQAYMYPYPDNTSQVIHLLRVRELEDFTGAANTADFPIRWVNVLVYGLAEKLSNLYQMPLQERSFLMSRYQYYKQAAKADDQEIIQNNFVDNTYPYTRMVYRNP